MAEGTSQEFNISNVIDEKLITLDLDVSSKEEMLTRLTDLLEEQGKLTAELKKSIEEAATLVVVEDLYRPYRPKRRTRATIAKEKGFFCR